MCILANRPPPSHTTTLCTTGLLKLELLGKNRGACGGRRIHWMTETSPLEIPISWIYRVYRIHPERSSFPLVGWAARMSMKVPTCLVILPLLLADVMFCSRCTMGDEAHPEDVFLGQGRGFGNDPADFQTHEISGRDEEERLWRVFEQEARRVCGGFGGHLSPTCRENHDGKEGSLGCSGHGRCLEEVRKRE